MKIWLLDGIDRKYLYEQYFGHLLVDIYQCQKIPVTDRESIRQSKNKVVYISTRKEPYSYLSSEVIDLKGNRVENWVDGFQTIETPYTFGEFMLDYGGNSVKTIQWDKSIGKLSK